MRAIMAGKRRGRVVVGGSQARHGGICDHRDARKKNIATTPPVIARSAKKKKKKKAISKP